MNKDSMTDTDFNHYYQLQRAKLNSMQRCTLCDSIFMTRDLRTQYCGNCLKLKPLVDRYRGRGGSLTPATKKKILDSHFKRPTTTFEREVK